jgi:thioredoxin-like negative regulator of GroEL
MSQFLFLDIEQLEQRLEFNDGLMLVHFGSPLVSSCSFAQRSLALIAPDFVGQLQIATVDVPLQDVKKLQKFSIRTVPTLVLFDGSREVERLDKILLPAELRFFLRDAMAFYGEVWPAPKNEDHGFSS